MTVTDDAACPRCGSPDDVSDVTRNDGPVEIHCGYCDHRWGEGYPDSQGSPLVDGFIDCPRCAGRGAVWGTWRDCAHCDGIGVVEGPRTGATP